MEKINSVSFTIKLIKDIPFEIVADDNKIFYPNANAGGQDILINFDESNNAQIDTVTISTLFK